MPKRDVDDFIKHWSAAAAPVSPAALAQQFKRAQPAAVAEILQTLATFGRAHRKGKPVYEVKTKTRRTN
jgi:hypothetical protein